MADSEVVILADVRPSLEDYLAVLERSTLGQRRPMEDAETMRLTHQNTNLWGTAWMDEKLVGFARCLTDFSYCCYLCDLAVDQACQHHGIGTRLIHAVRAALGPHGKIILLSAPKAVDYYPRIGFQQHPSAWILEPGQELHP
jgi:ribosomal protein S18 acetylase RimI-like enzyme